LVTGNQARTLKNIVSSKMKSSSLRVLAVSSGKGGVGKTNIVANLAYVLSKQGKKVLVVDADLGLNNIDILLGLNPKFHIGHVLSGRKMFRILSPRVRQVSTCSQLEADYKN